MWKLLTDPATGFVCKVMQHFLYGDELLANYFCSLGEAAFPGFRFVVELERKQVSTPRM